MSKSSVPDILNDAAELFKSRNAEYGNAYKNHPSLMFAMLGNIELKTEEDYNRYEAITSIVGKLNRYCKNFNNGGHKDSADDLVVYAAMLAEIHSEESK